VVPVAQDNVSFTVQGDAQILGVGNGDPGSHEADRFIEDVAVLRFRNWEMADLSPEQSMMPDVAKLAWRDPFRWYPPGTGPKTPEAFALRGHLDAGTLTPGARRTLFVPLLAARQRLFVNGVDVTDRVRKDADGWSVLLKDQAAPSEVLLIVPDGERALAALQVVGDHGNNVAYLQSATPAAAWSRRLFNGHAQAIVRLGTGSGGATLTVRAPGLATASVTLDGRDVSSPSR
jgi:beta-galactosidase